MEIPVVFEGSAPGVLTSGGVYPINKRKLKVRAIPENLPDFLTADISSLELGNKLLIDEIKSDDYTILHQTIQFYVKVRTSRGIN